MIVGVLALDQVMGCELMIPGQVLGMANLAAAEPRAAGRDGAPPARPGYEERVCGATPVDQHQTDPGRVEMRRSYRMDALVEADLVVMPGRQHLTREFCFLRLYFGLRGHSRIALPTDHWWRQQPAVETRHRHTLRMYSTVSSVISANSRSEATQAFDQKTRAQQDQTRRRYPGRIHRRIGATVG
jgi:hypothetical protein